MEALNENGFYNIRSSFKVVGGLVDIGTHMSLIKLESGKFLVVDTVELTPSVKCSIDSLTNNGELIDSVIGTHPFHTIYFSPFYKVYPNAKYYGTPRHLRNNKTIPWVSNIDNPEVMKQWESNGVYLRIPAGSEFVNPDENNHFSSVFVFHAPSKSIHVDDTIMYFVDPGFVLRILGKRTHKMEFWDLKKGLSHTSQAPNDFKVFVQSIIHDWDFDSICTAHTGNMIGGAKKQLINTLEHAEPVLCKLAKSYASNV